AKLSIEIDFKTQAKASLIGVFISGIVGIYMAYKGYGVWSLVVNIILNNLIQTALLWYFLKWKPLWIFSFDSFTKLFSFGSKILASNLLHTIYLNLYTMIIGKRFSATSLGYYTRADQFAQFPSSNITGILQRVTYPILSSIQDDDERLRNIYRQYVKLFAFIVFPLMLGLAVTSKPFIILILTEKWLGVVPLLQILCVYYMWYPINAIHQNLMQVKGRSDLFLKLEFVKKIIGIGLLFIFLPFGINALAWSLVVYSLISLGLNTYYASRLIDFSIKNQLIDILRIFIISSIMAAVVYLINYLDISNWLKIILAIASGAILYTAMAKIFRFDEINQLINLVRNKV
ncbi:MAG: lipopolysaccharide biosynthesis protein, partial [Bacteroidales bacterium]|nr:lipopolysaccharide biosynthesis protein [Bacteroidales bacterium]